MPALGMAQETGLIVAWRKAEGDPVAIGDPLFDVETDKTTMEVEAAHAGTLTEIRASAGADIPVGQTIAIIVPTGTRVDLAHEPATMVETKPPTPPATPTAQKPPEPQTLPNKPAAPSTPSIVSTILASPKARFEAHRRGIDLRRLVDQGIPQPFHVADLDRLQPETATAATPAMSQLSATLDLEALGTFVAWAEEKTGTQNMRVRVLATFAASALRSDNTSNLIVSVLSIRGDERAFRDPDLRGLGEPEDTIAESSGGSIDLVLVDLAGTRLADYRPPARSGCPTVVLSRGSENGAVATLHFCEDDLHLLSAASFLDRFAGRIEEPALQLL
jgi:pyruvate dehydrogenase E2 component (dihydrolipoamide acetyltransferase)/2-oxoglutarate dehydrogenase E2 component (dihydrolipoamide succinyltransferase)